jgi:hypothetical protein
MIKPHRLWVALQQITGRSGEVCPGSQRRWLCLEQSHRRRRTLSSVVSCWVFLGCSGLPYTIGSYTTLCVRATQLLLYHARYLKKLRECKFSFRESIRFNVFSAVRSSKSKMNKLLLPRNSACDSMSKLTTVFAHDCSFFFRLFLESGVLYVLQKRTSSTVRPTLIDYRYTYLIERIISIPRRRCFRVAL